MISYLSGEHADLWFGCDLRRYLIHRHVGTVTVTERNLVPSGYYAQVREAARKGMPGAYVMLLGRPVGRGLYEKYER